jgi:lysophospholipase L1-like esterase
MFRKNHITPVFVLIFFVFIFLYAISLLPDNLNILGLQLKPVDLFSDLKEDQEYLNYTFSSDSISDNTNKTVKLSLDDLVNVITEPIEENHGEGLKKFYDKLRNYKQGDNIRIAYFGDSMIEGDLFSKDLRDYLQKKFGGSGIGFVPITDNNAGSWATINFNFCDNFLKYSVITKKPNNYNYGINGYVYLTDTSNVIDTIKNKKEYWVEYSGRNFIKAKLFFTSYSDSSYFTYVVNNQTTKVHLGKNLSIGMAEINNINSNKIRFNFYGKLALYGVSFENEAGIFVDNFAVRGHSGLNLTRIPKSVLQAFNSYFDYNLIILQYGANVLDESVHGYEWYKQGLIKAIRHLQSAFPDASILVVSAADRSKKDINGFSTIKNIYNLIEAQELAAKETGASFWNLFKAMGGDNSMPVWVNGKMAAPDYTHFNHSGSSVLSKKLTFSLLKNL